MTTELETLRALEKRVSEATGRDMALARQIQCTIGGWHRYTPTQLRRKNPGFISPDDYIGEMSDGSPVLDGLHGTDIHCDVPDCLLSLDAAVALVERVLPDNAGIDIFIRGASTAFIYDGNRADTEYRGTGKKAALALICATLRALIAQEEGNG